MKTPRLKSWPLPREDNPLRANRPLELRVDFGIIVLKTLTSAGF